MLLCVPPGRPVLGTAAACLALVAWYRSDLDVLARVAHLNLLGIFVVLPALAAAGGWLLAGREPGAIARQPIE